MAKQVGLVIILALILSVSNMAVFAQVEATPDSIQVNTPASAPKEKTGLTKPNRAALYSAVLPGAGQFYNKDYWKVPVIYVVGGTLAYFIITNHQSYASYNKAYGLRTDGDTSTVDEFQDEYPSPAGDAFIKNSRDFYRRNRDLSIILAVLAYGMNIIEANVGAHLNEFDISDDLSLNVKPDMLRVAGSRAVPGISLNLHLKK